MRKFGKIDANQKSIVEALRRIGISVMSTSSLGNGFPDLVAGYQGKNYLLEIKDGTKPQSAQKLTEMEQRFHDTWRGTVHSVASLEEAIKAIVGVHGL